jgi:N-acylglucosamine-6-phosphate 2-epimerase
MKKGLIVSIQNWTQDTTNELASMAIKGGAIAIRTDKPLLSAIDIIGLKKDFTKEFYITPTIEDVKNVSEWADYIAIDSRIGNKEIEILYKYCRELNKKIVADIEDLKDVENIIKYNPDYIATTFSKGNIELIKEIKNIADIPVIAEGGYDSKEKIKQAIKNGAHAICIGEAISDIFKLTKKFIGYFNE